MHSAHTWHRIHLTCAPHVAVPIWDLTPTNNRRNIQHLSPMSYVSVIAIHKLHIKTNAFLFFLPNDNHVCHEVSDGIQFTNKTSLMAATSSSGVRWGFSSWCVRLKSGVLHGACFGVCHPEWPMTLYSDTDIFCMTKSLSCQRVAIEGLHYAY